MGCPDSITSRYPRCDQPEEARTTGRRAPAMEKMNCRKTGEEADGGREQNQTPVVLSGKAGYDAKHWPQPTRAEPIFTPCWVSRVLSEVKTARGRANQTCRVG